MNRFPRCYMENPTEVSTGQVRFISIAIGVPSLCVRKRHASFDQLIVRLAATCSSFQHTSKQCFRDRTRKQSRQDQGTDSDSLSSGTKPVGSAATRERTRQSHDCLAPTQIREVKRGDSFILPAAK